MMSVAAAGSFSLMYMGRPHLVTPDLSDGGQGGRFQFSMRSECSSPRLGVS